ncbi:epoxyqueuosine reductase QueH [Candidatus Peregrinibacteria bacterium]|nr:epoxyqueuosine reductase QueH [Candidatus Peregrinibacteria bacterium]
MQKLLLHVCCGPDASIPFLDLRDQYDILAFWYDPNIHPEAEYWKRLRAFREVAERENITFLEGAYEPDVFFRLVQGHEHEPEKGSRCTICYSFRMKRAVEVAVENGCSAWTTSLNISPHKNFETLTAIGTALAAQHGIPYLAIPFFKKNGFARSVAYCKEYGIYRQKYCGCVYSETYPEKFQIS